MWSLRVQSDTRLNPFLHHKKLLSYALLDLNLSSSSHDSSIQSLFPFLVKPGGKMSSVKIGPLIQIWFFTVTTVFIKFCAQIQAVLLFVGTHMYISDASISIVMSGWTFNFFLETYLACDIFSLFSLCFTNYSIFNTVLVLSQILKRVSFSSLFWHSQFIEIRKQVNRLVFMATSHSQSNLHIQNWNHQEKALPWKKIKQTCQRQVNTFPHESYLTHAWRRLWSLPVSLNKTENKSERVTCGLITFSTFSPWSRMTFRLMGNLGQGYRGVNIALALPFEFLSEIHCFSQALFMSYHRRHLSIYAIHELLQ